MRREHLTGIARLPAARRKIVQELPRRCITARALGENLLAGAFTTSPGGKEAFMVRGCQKQMIHLKTTDNRFFEEAYLVLRPAALDGLDGDKRPDLVAEAERLVKESLARVYPSAARRRRSGKCLLLYFSGVFSAAALIAAAFFLSRLF